MAEVRELAVSSLWLDSRNPRLPEGADGQPELIRIMAEVQGDKLLALAEDILDQGRHFRTACRSFATSPREATKSAKLIRSVSR